MKRTITQNEIAKKLGLSRSTVAAALNPASTIKLTEETRRRVAQAAEISNYRPDRYARVMRGGKSNLIGILHFGGLLQVAAERAFYATAALGRTQFEILSADLSWSPDSVRHTCLSMIDARVEGVVIAGLNNPDALPALKQFRDADIPAVALSGNPVPGVPHFRGDARQAFSDLTRHLLHLGHRRLGLLLPLPRKSALQDMYTWAGQERMGGFESGLRAAGGRIVKSFQKMNQAETAGVVFRAVLSDDLFNPFETGRQGMHKILASAERPSAVLCSNDELAYGAMQACREKGVAVPRQMAITGFDDIALGRYCEVPMTTIRQPNEAMANAAVKTLLALIGKTRPKKPDPARIFRCRLVVRASCGASA